MISYLMYGVLITAALMLFNRLRQGPTTPTRRPKVTGRDNTGTGSDSGYYNSSSDNNDRNDDRDNSRDCRDDDGDGGSDNSCNGSDSGGGDGGGGGD
jgi:hypothetical protein